MAIVDLSQFNWSLKGWRPFHWKLHKSIETGIRLLSDTTPITAVVPGSVQQSLIQASIIDDPSYGTNTRNGEWVEHRQWDYTVMIPASVLDKAKSVEIYAEALDYSGWIIIDGKEVCSFQNALEPFKYDLSKYLLDGQDHRLSILFDMPPNEQGQIGWTSQTKYFKPRYNYSWDWCPRWVSIGIQGPIQLRTDLDVMCSINSLHTQLDDNLKTGSVSASIQTANLSGHTARITLKDDNNTIYQKDFPISSDTTELTITNFEVKLWWPNRCGEQHLYLVEISITDDDGRVLWHQSRQVGFKNIKWKPCKNASSNAEPWICQVNGKDIFLQGVNWTPVHLNYLDADQQRYKRLIDMYKKMGCNLLRVWGGGFLETQQFYQLCDNAGLMVWQEFPLSSSGLDNQTPNEQEVLHCLESIARSYITRRRHHISLLLWCGGNELDQGPDRSHRTPLTNDDPCLKMLKNLVDKLDPQRRFVPTSPSGPSCFASSANFGTGIHHDVHGPWDMNNHPDRIKGWCKYWENDDALFRSEVGLPAAASASLIRRFSNGMSVWAPTGDYWQHSAAWWTQWWILKNNFDPDSQAELERYVDYTQKEQAEGLSFAALCCKKRFPECGGFLVWMGHDAHPCPANTSIIQFDDSPKPSYDALKKVFLSDSL